MNDFKASNPSPGGQTWEKMKKSKVWTGKQSCFKILLNKQLSICTCPTPRIWRTFWSGGGFKSAGGFLLHTFNTQLDVKSTVHIHLKKWLQFLSAPDDIRQDHAKGHLALQGCQNIPTSMCSFAIFGTTAQAENFVWVQLCRWDQHTYDEQIQRHQESPTPCLFELYNSSFEREERKQLTNSRKTTNHHWPSSWNLHK